MHRVVYCPTSKTADDASALASEWGLPIQHGDSERTEFMDFDRETIQILSIPIDKGFGFDEIEFRINRPAQIKYSNDWDDVSEYSFILRPYGVKVGKLGWSVPAMLMDSHRAVMNISVSYPGKYELVSVLNNIERESVMITVHGFEVEEI
jgi:hypothetical protein